MTINEQAGLAIVVVDVRGIRNAAEARAIMQMWNEQQPSDGAAA